MAKGPRKAPKTSIRASRPGRARTPERTETGVLRPPQDRPVHVALCYPNTYGVGMSNLGFQAIYRILNETPYTLAERAFVPEPHDAAVVTIESGRALCAFDVVAFSVSFEPDYLNVLRILGAAGIPLERDARSEDDPLVLGGGVACFLNPEPVADFFDLFVLGEGEEVAHDLARVLAATEDMPKRERLRELARLRGVYVPGHFDVTYGEDDTIASVRNTMDLPPTVPRVQLRQLGDTPTSTVVQTDDTEFGEMYLTEVNRGCPRGCSTRPKARMPGRVQRPMAARASGRPGGNAAAPCPRGPAAPTGALGSTRWPRFAPRPRGRRCAAPRAAHRRGR